MRPPRRHIVGNTCEEEQEGAGGGGWGSRGTSVWFWALQRTAKPRWGRESLTVGELAAVCGHLLACQPQLIRLYPPSTLRVSAPVSRFWRERDARRKERETTQLWPTVFHLPSPHGQGTPGRVSGVCSSPVGLCFVQEGVGARPLQRLCGEGGAGRGPSQSNDRQSAG